MARSLIDGIYDLYLQRSGNGSQYDVPIHIRDGSNIEELEIRVWARSPAEAEERALALAHTMDYKRRQGIHDKSLGVILPKEHYKPKGVLRTISSPIAVWRDPVYKKGASNILNNVGYKAGTMFRLSVKGLLKVITGTNEESSLSKEYLEKVLRVNIVSFFIWIAFSLIGLMFLALGFSSGHEGKFVISWLNQYRIAGIVCIIIGVLALTKTFKDYLWITRRLQELDDSGEELDG